MTELVAHARIRKAYHVQSLKLLVNRVLPMATTSAGASRKVRTGEFGRKLDSRIKAPRPQLTIQVLQTSESLDE
jgi:hypothetical protein